MSNKVNLLTGEIINKGDLHEQLVFKLPIPIVSNSLISKLKKRLEESNLDEEERIKIEKTIQEIQEEDSIRKYTLYNMRGYGYQFGGANGNGDYGSFDHFLLDLCHEMNREGIAYIIKASVYTLFSHSSYMLNSALRTQNDLSDDDKKILNDYIDRQVDEYAEMDNEFNLVKFDEECKITDKLLYDTFFCKVILKNKRLYVQVGSTEKALPDNLLLYMDTDKAELREKLLELIVRYELYLSYGIHCPFCIKAGMYTDSKFLEQHQSLKEQSALELRRRLQFVLANSSELENINKNSNEILLYIRKIVGLCFIDKSENEIESLRNYWLLHSKEFTEILNSILDSDSMCSLRKMEQF